MADIRAAFSRTGQGRLRLDQAGLGYKGNQQYLTFTGWHVDGTPFVFASAPFNGDPDQRAREIAADLIRAHTGKPLPPVLPTFHVKDSAMPAPQPIKDLASILRGSLKDATDRAQKLAHDVQGSVANLHVQMDTAEKVKSEVDEAAAAIQQAIGTDNGGPSLGPLPEK